MSLSIDDLFVLNRFLQTGGELCHYLMVRQIVAGLRGALLFDELDHLGAYLARNRFDFDLKAQLVDHDTVSWDSFSTDVDRYFEGDRWRTEPPPTQEYPTEIRMIVDALSGTRAHGWRNADARIRDMNGKARADLARIIRELNPSLDTHGKRWIVFGENPPLLIWMVREGITLDQADLERRAEVASLAANSSEIQCVVVTVNSDGIIKGARGLCVQSPPIVRADYQELVKDSEIMKMRMCDIDNMRSPLGAALPLARAIGRNSPCWCGSGRKFKKCHGAPTSRP